MMDADGLLRVVTFSSGVQPFVVRCEQETRVRDIVQAIAEIWGFKEAASLFTLCKPATDCPNTSDVLQLLRGASLLTWQDRPCKTQAGVVKPDKAPLLLIRCIFGNTPVSIEHNEAVQSLTAVQIAADVAIGRYPQQVDANLLQHLVKQGQHALVLQMATSWPSGPCLTMGPAQVLAGRQGLQLPVGVNLGLNAKGVHIMDSQCYRMHMPIDIIRTLAAAGDVLNITTMQGSTDLLLQLSGAEAFAEAFRVQREAFMQQLQQRQQLLMGASGGRAGARGAGPLSVQIQLVPEPPVVRAVLEVVEAEQQLLAVQLHVQEAGAAENDDEQLVKLQLTALPTQHHTEPPVRVKLRITPLPEAAAAAHHSQEKEQQMVRLVVKVNDETQPAAPAAEAVAGAAAPTLPAADHPQQLLHMLQQKSAGQQHAVPGSSALLPPGSLGLGGPLAHASAGTAAHGLSLSMPPGQPSMGIVGSGLPGTALGLPSSATAVPGISAAQQLHELRPGLFGMPEHQASAGMPNADASAQMMPHIQMQSTRLGAFPRGGNNNNGAVRPQGLSMSIAASRPLYPAQNIVRPPTPGARTRPAFPGMLGPSSGNDVSFSTQHNLLQSASGAMLINQQGQLLRAGSASGHMMMPGQPYNMSNQPAVIQQLRPAAALQYAAPAPAGMQNQHQLRQQLPSHNQPQLLQVAQPQHPQQQLVAPPGYMIVQQQPMQPQLRSAGMLGNQQMVMMPAQQQQLQAGGMQQQAQLSQQTPMVLVTTADGRQVLVPEQQLQTLQQVQAQPQFQQQQLQQQSQFQPTVIQQFQPQPQQPLQQQQQQPFAGMQQQQPQHMVQQQQQLLQQPRQQPQTSHLNQGVFVMGPNGDLVPAAGQVPHMQVNGAATSSYQPQQQGILQQGSQFRPQQQQLFSQQMQQTSQTQQQMQQLQLQQQFQQQINMPVALSQVNNQNTSLAQLSQLRVAGTGQQDMLMLQGGMQANGVLDYNAGQQQQQQQQQQLMNAGQNTGAGAQLQMQQVGLGLQQQQMQGIGGLGGTVGLSSATSWQLGSQALMLPQHQLQKQQQGLVGMQGLGQQPQQLFAVSHQQLQQQPMPQMLMPAGGFGDTTNGILAQQRRSSGTNMAGGSLFPSTGRQFSSSGPPSGSSGGLGGLQNAIGSNRMDPSLPGLGNFGLGMGVGVIGDGAGNNKPSGGGIGLSGVSGNVTGGAFGPFSAPASHSSLDNFSLGGPPGVDPPGLNFSGAGLGSAFGASADLPKVPNELTNLGGAGQLGLGMSTGLTAGGLGVADGATGGFVFHNGTTGLTVAGSGSQGMFGTDLTQSSFF